MPIFQALEDFTRLPDPHRDRAPARPLAQRDAPHGLPLGDRARRRRWCCGASSARSTSTSGWARTAASARTSCSWPASLLVVGGVVILVRTRSRWKHWLLTHHAPDRRRAPSRGERGATGLSSLSAPAARRAWRDAGGCASPRAVALALDGERVAVRKIQPTSRHGRISGWPHRAPPARRRRLVDPSPHRSVPLSTTFRPALRKGNRPMSPPPCAASGYGSGPRNWWTRPSGAARPLLHRCCNVLATSRVLHAPSDASGPVRGPSPDSRERRGTLKASPDETDMAGEREVRAHGHRPAVDTDDEREDLDRRGEGGVARRARRRADARRHLRADVPDRGLRPAVGAPRSPDRPLGRRLGPEHGPGVRRRAARRGDRRRRTPRGELARGLQRP